VNHVSHNYAFVACKTGTSKSWNKAIAVLILEFKTNARSRI